MSEGLWNIILVAPLFLFSLCIHEFAHAWTSVKLGDATPQLAGRLTIHPMAHADLIGTIVLPLLCLYNHWPFIGWAKPVPVDARNYKSPRTGMALVAAAGPVSNLLLSLLFTLLVAGLKDLDPGHQANQNFFQIAVMGVQINVMLALFNLIPIPPLDGFSVLQGLVPRTIARQLDHLYRYAGLALLLILAFGGFRYLTIPVHLITNQLLNLAGL